MRTIFFGTSEFAVIVLRALAASEHAPALVVAPPDRPRGRGRRIGRPPVAATATELGVPLLQTEASESTEALARIRGAEAGAGVVCAFGQLIREPLLSELCLLNVHPSLLPRWRGAAPIERAIMAGDERTGTTIMRLAEGLDAGPVALAEAVAVGDRDYGGLAPELAALGARLIVRALGELAAGRLVLRDQDERQATYAEKISSADRRLDPGRPAAELVRIVRALTPHIGSYLELADGTRLGVRRAEAERESRLAAGEVVAARGELRVGCGAGALSLREVQPAGGRPMAAADYLRGHPPPRLA